MTHAHRSEGSRFVDLAESDLPLAFVTRTGTGASDAHSEGAWRYRVEVLGLRKFQKEGLVEDLDTGRTWRLAADEGTYLGGTGYAPAPLAHWVVGLHGDLTSRVATQLQEEGAPFTSLHTIVSQGFAAEGSFAKGEAIARVFDLTIDVRISTSLTHAVVTSVVDRALTKSPTMAAMLHAAEGTFALTVNGSKARVHEVPASTADAQSDPFLRYSARPVPAAEEATDPALQVKLPVNGTRDASDIALTDDQSKIVGWRVEASGSYDLVSGLVASTVDFPGVSEPRAATLAPSAATRGPDAWKVISDATNLRAPSGLAYFSTGTAFCYHTQLARYAAVRRMNIEEPRLVQTSEFASGADVAVANAVDTQLFVRGALDEPAAASLLLAALNTCYAHRALGQQVERPQAVVSTSASTTDSGLVHHRR